MTATMRNGAKVSKRPPAAPPEPFTKVHVEVEVRDQDWQNAYVLARANPHKSWARRWLRANGLRRHDV